MIVGGPLASCAPATDTGEDIESVSSAVIGAVVSDYFDSTGTIHARIYACAADATAPGHHDLSCALLIAMISELLTPLLRSVRRHLQLGPRRGRLQSQPGGQPAASGEAVILRR